MRYIADFHIHSKYSRATSRDMDLEHLTQWAKIKGIQILGTGDFTHPAWFKELKEKLIPVADGLYQLKPQLTKYPSNQVTKFLLTTEISCIYSKNNKTRRIHLVVFAPNLEIVEKINQKLGGKFNLVSDGRPILGIDAQELTKILLDISGDCLIVCAHAWTPWYSIFGSKSGFDSIEECFGEMTPYIHALETGLSSDPGINWRWSALDGLTLISNSDAHSPKNLGREANVFEGNKIDYNLIVKAIKLGVRADESPVIRRGDGLKLIKTIEFFPEEGKYHWDGHRECGVRYSPKESKEHRNICPKCHRPLTLGVMHRVEDLADRGESFKPSNAIPFKSLIPLAEIIAEAMGQGKASQGVEREYNNLIEKGGSEFEILMDLSEQELKKITFPQIVQGIMRMRQNEVRKEAGYDGVYGKISVFEETDLILRAPSSRRTKLTKIKKTGQKTLF